MSNVIPLVRAVARRVMGAASPTLDDVVNKTMKELMDTLPQGTISIEEFRYRAKKMAEVNATRAIASARHAAVGAGRQSTLPAVEAVALAARTDAQLNRLIYDLQCSAQARERAIALPLQRPVDSTGELVVVA